MTRELRSNRTISVQANHKAVSLPTHIRTVRALVVHN